MDAGLQQAAFLARLHHLEWVARACDAARELNHIHWAADSIEAHAEALQTEPPETLGLLHTEGNRHDRHPQ